MTQRLGHLKRRRLAGVDKNKNFVPANSNTTISLLSPGNNNNVKKPKLSEMTTAVPQNVVS